MKNDNSTAPPEEGSNDGLDSFGGPEGCVTRWLKELEHVQQSKAHRDFIRVGERIVEKYKNQSGVQEESRLLPLTTVMINVLWANVQVLSPVLFCRLPKVVASRISDTKNPVSNLAARMIEWCTQFNLTVQHNRAKFAGKQAVMDRLLPGKGQVWLRYDCEFEERQDDDGNPIVDDDGNPVRFPKPNTERIWIDPLYWQDYLESISRNPYENRWRAKREYMTRNQLIKRFGEKGKQCSLTVGKSGKRKSLKNNDTPDFLQQAEVWEIEDEETKCRYWISEGLKTEPLDYRTDVFKVDGFFTTPIPLLATTTSDSSYPTPDYKIYERLADELDYTAKRLNAMVEAVRLVGAMAKQYSKDVRNILKLKDGDLWPVDGWKQYQEKGGLQGVIDWLPFDRAVAAIPVLSNRCQEIVQQIYEVTGIPDIVRGSTNPQETLGAQQEKSHWTVVRIMDKQEDVQRFWQEIVSKTAEMIFEEGLFSDETISLMCSIQDRRPEDQANFPAALQLLRSDRLRTFQVVVETDSTIAPDEERMQARWAAFISSITQLMGQLQQVASFRPELMEPMIESIMSSVNTMRTGRQVSESWQNALDAVKQSTEEAKNAPPPPPPPDYQQMLVQIEGQKAQTAAQKAMSDANIELQKLQQDFTIKMEDLRIKGVTANSKAYVDQLNTDLDKWRADFESWLETEKLKIERFRVVSIEQEKLIEESRLREQEQIDAAKVVERANIGATAPPVTVNTGPVTQIAPPKQKPRRVRARRLPDGTLEGEIDGDLDQVIPTVIG